MRLPLAITMGDPAGIGPEVCVKALAIPELRSACIPVLIGDGGMIQSSLRRAGLTLKPVEILSPEEATGNPAWIEYMDPRALSGPVLPGQCSAACGEASFRYILEAIALAKAKQVAAVVTGPISKEALHLAGHPFAGHTEIFAHYTNTSDYAMLLVSGPLRVIHVTTHVSLSEACRSVTREQVLQTIRLARHALRLLGLPEAVIGVAALNPHASENGLFGAEEALAIVPAIQQAQEEGLAVQGPIPADTVFVKAAAGQYGMVVAMYHDQGHIPLKFHGFRMDPLTKEFSHVGGVNTTIGLPILRTSVDHGTAFDRAGKNLANPQSMVDAVLLACQMAPHYKGGLV